MPNYRDGRGWEGTFADPYACGEASYQFTAGMLEAGARLGEFVERNILMTT